jgi:type IV pilus assembly protein PilY1
VMDRMYKLADKDYANRHEYFVNAAPVIGDIYIPPVAPATVGTWKTIIVGGLGAGGRGYYALDITNPDSPSLLWEFSNDVQGGNSNLGQSFGNPVITKRADGTWVVAFTSGYNNVSYVGDLTPGDGAVAGDGNGHLFLVNANTGERLVDIATYTSVGVPAGTATTPSGLSKVNAWVDTDVDNTAKRFYAGDLLGNLWRFDTDSLVAPTNAALRLAYFAAGGVAQPITTQPSLAQVSYGGSQYAVAYVGTGKYLGTTDLGNTALQSVYAIKDPLTNTAVGDAHASSSVVAQTLSLSNPADQYSTRNVTSLPVNWQTGNGWRVDLTVATLPTPGERVNVDMQLLNNTLSVATNIPASDVCSSGGTSYFYQFDIGTGSRPSTLNTAFVGQWLGGSMVVGLSWVTLQVQGGTPGSGRTVTIAVDSKSNPRTDDVPPADPPPSVGRRTSWRELVN